MKLHRRYITISNRWNKKIVVKYWATVRPNSIRTNFKSCPTEKVLDDSSYLSLPTATHLSVLDWFHSLYIIVLCRCHTVCHHQHLVVSNKMKFMLHFHNIQKPDLVSKQELVCITLLQGFLLSKEEGYRIPFLVYLSWHKSQKHMGNVVKFCYLVDETISPYWIMFS